MQKILFLSETEEGQLNRGSLEALTAARELATSLGASLVAGLFGENVDGASAVVAGAGAQSVYVVSGSEFGPSRYATDCIAAEGLVKTAAPDIVIAPSSSRISRMLPGVAYRVNGRIDTHVASCRAENGNVVIGRWYYRQRMEAEQKRSARPWFLTVDPGNFSAWKGPSALANVETVNVALSEALLRTRFEGFSQPGTSEQTIKPDAELLFVAGAGWTKKQADGAPHADRAAELILGFLRKSHASLGGSKSIVDLSGEGQAVLPFMTHLNQIGQTGASPRHPKGLATCCHGEEPHVIGWRFIKERRAVNLNPNCGWAQGKADVLYVADAFEVIAKVISLL